MWTNLIELGLVCAKRFLARLEQRFGVGPSLGNIDVKVLTLGVSAKRREKKCQRGGIKKQEASGEEVGLERQGGEGTNAMALKGGDEQALEVPTGLTDNVALQIPRVH